MDNLIQDALRNTHVHAYFYVQTNFIEADTAEKRIRRNLKFRKITEGIHYLNRTRATEMPASKNPLLKKESDHRRNV